VVIERLLEKLLFSRRWLLAPFYAGLVASLLPTCPLLANEEFPISGIYQAGRPCRGAEAKSGAVLITITPQQITHPGGVCTIDDSKAQGTTAVLRTTCKDSQGKILIGEVRFTMRTADVIDVVALDGAYKAVLNRCPEGVTPTQVGSPGKPAGAETAPGVTAPKF
jgi:hypothetical protein